MEDAEGMKAVCPAISTALDFTGGLVAGERFRFLEIHPLTSFDS